MKEKQEQYLSNGGILKMGRTVGTTIRGIRAPIVKEGDDIVEIVACSLKRSWESENYKIGDRDVVGITESLVARAQGNYVTVDDVAKEISDKFRGDVGIVFPILSRNRFSMILKGIARGSENINLLLSYPDDEVGNSLMDINKMNELGINPYTDVLTEKEYRSKFGDNVKHPFTGIDYIHSYRKIIESQGADASVYLSNKPKTILKYTKHVLTADIHTRERTKKILREEGADIVFGLDDICNTSVNGSGYNEQYGLLGSNKSTDERLKLFPRVCDRDGSRYVTKIQSRLKELTGKHVEIMVYGDGAFKDPVGKIWELADPVVSPDFTEGLEGTPSELKLKYFADNELRGLTGEDAGSAMKQCIKEKEENLVGSMASQGTTPRQLTDLLGSLCDLTSGSGDKGTPIVLIQGYFDNFASE